MIHLATAAGSHLQGDDERTIGFCSYCGHMDDDPRRVCSECGLGVRLRTAAGVIGSPGASFLVVRADGLVSAVSAAAERLFAGRGQLVGRPLPALLASSKDDTELPQAVALAAAGNPLPVTLPVEPVGVSRRRAEMWATVAPCAAPPAALVVLEREPRTP